MPNDRADNTAAAMSTTQAAQLLGCSGDWLRLWCLGEVGPAMPHQRRGRRYLVDPAVAFEHITKHSRRLPRGFRNPREAADVSTTTTSPEGPDTRADDHRHLTLDELDRELAHEAAKATPDANKIRALNAAFAARLKSRQFASKDGKNLPPSDVGKMLQSCGELWAEMIDEQAHVMAKRLVALLRERFAVDLVAKNADAERLLESLVREEYGNDCIIRIRKRVEEQVRGVRRMEFE